MTRAEPPVTWLMPVKNGMPYLSETLDSIVKQTYKNYSILVRDDGSTDGTLDELKRWIPARIPGQIFTGPSLGIGRSLAFLVEQARTEFCARIDADDVNLPQRLERQVDFLIQHPKVGVVGSQIVTIDGSGNGLGEYDHETEDAEIRWLSRYGCRICHPAAMFRRSVVIAIGNYRDIARYEDADLWLRMSRVAEMANLPERLLCYRRFSASVTGSVRDWLPVLREGALLNAATLFPGIADPEKAMDLWEATVPRRLTYASQVHHPAKLSHLRALKRSAVLLAREVRKPDNYFTDTESFREQYWLLRRRVLNRFGLGPLLRLRERVASRRALRNQAS